MASPNEAPNPYQSPSTAAEPQPGLALPAIDYAMVKKFRDQIHALGALWIILGCAAFAMAALALRGNPDLAAALGGGAQVQLVFVAIMGLMWLTVGVLACRKHLGAVYAGLVLSYLSLLGQVLNFSLCAAILLVIVILQAHRVIGWAKRMRVAGVPLTVRSP